MTTTSYDSTSVDLRRQIHMLAEQARQGDIAGVTKGLGRLDESLRAAEAADEVGHLKRTEPTSKTGDQISPAS